MESGMRMDVLAGLKELRHPASRGRECLQLGNGKRISKDGTVARLPFVMGRTILWAAENDLFKNRF